MLLSTPLCMAYALQGEFLFSTGNIIVQIAEEVSDLTVAIFWKHIHPFPFLPLCPHKLELWLFPHYYMQGAFLSWNLVGSSLCFVCFELCPKLQGSRVYS